MKTIKRLHHRLAVYAIFVLVLPSVSLAQESITVPCTIEGYYRIDVMPRLEAYVGKIPIDLGDVVKKDDVLIELHAPEIFAKAVQQEKLVESALASEQAVNAELAGVNARFTSIEARTDLRKSEWERMQNLVTSGVITRSKEDEAKYAYSAVVSELESVHADVKAVEARRVAAKADVEVAKANHEYARVMTEYLTIRAPFDGVIVRRSVDPGAYVRPPSGDNSMGLVELEQVDKVRAVIMIPYSSATRVNVGSGVTLSGFRGRDKLEISTKVTRIASGYEPGSRTMRAEVELDNKANASGQRTLRSGDYGSATITLSAEGSAMHDPATLLHQVDEVVLQTDGKSDGTGEARNRLKDIATQEEPQVRSASFNAKQ